MRTVTRFALTACALAAVSFSGLTPAQATDFDAYARQHLLRVSDIPRTGLGDLGSKRFVSIPWSDAARQTFCYAGERPIAITGIRDARADFSVNEEVGPVLDEFVLDFPSPAAARRAFERAVGQARSCVGTTSIGDAASTTTYTYSQGSVPLVTVAGIPSFFFDTVRVFSGTNVSGGRDTARSYSVYSLVRDVVIVTSYTVFGGTADPVISTSQRRLVNETAAKAVTRWNG